MSLTEHLEFVKRVQAKRGQRIVAQLVRDLRKSVKSLQTQDPPGINLYNNTGDDVVEGDIVVLDTAADDSAVWAPDLGSVKNPFVVIAGGADGDLLRCAGRGYGAVVVICTAAAVNRGDQIIASNTVDGQGEADATPGANELLGIATTAKAGGAEGAVTIIISNN